MPHGAERCGNLLGEDPHVGSLRAAGLELERAGIEPDELQLVELDGTRCALDREPGARQAVERRPALLERRVHRRHLRARTEKPLEHRLDARAGQRRHGRLGHHLTLGIPGRRAPTQSNGEAVALGTSDDVAGDLGRLPEADRQHAGGERVEAAGVAGLLSLQEPPHALQSCVR